MQQVHLAPELLCELTTDEPTPFRVRKLGARAFWRTVRPHYCATSPDGNEHYSRGKIAGQNARDAIKAAFIRGWKVNMDGGELRLDRLAKMYATSKWAEPAHLIAAHVNGFDFYAEQFPLEEAA